MPVSARARAAMRWTVDDRLELAQLLYRAQRRTYERTLEDLAAAHGGGAVVAISRDVDRALRRDARDSATRIGDTHNAKLADFLNDLPVEITDAQAFDAFTRWSEDRSVWHTPLVAASEAARARNDATLAFWVDANATPAFDFLTAHSHSKAAACELCVALIATNPHTVEEVRALGTVHPGCVHEWVARPTVVPPGTRVGRTPGGILGERSLLEEMGGSKRRVAEVLRQPGGYRAVR